MGSDCPTATVRQRSVAARPRGLHRASRIPCRACHPTPPPGSRDAVFYQVFPDRLARSDRVPAPGELEPWEAPPTRAWLQGRRPLRCRRPPRPPPQPRHHGAVPEPRLHLCLQPSVSHRRLLPRGPPAGRRRGPARAARRGPRPRHARHPRRRLQPLRSRLLALPSRARERCALALSRVVPPRPRRRRRLALAHRVPDRGRAGRHRCAAGERRAQRRRLAGGPRLRGLVGSGGPAQARPRRAAPAGARPGCRRALASLRHRRLAPRRGRGDRHRLLARVPGTRCGPSSRTPTWWPRSGASSRSGWRATPSTPSWTTR